MTKIIYNVRVGKPDVHPATPAHTQGVQEGNAMNMDNEEPGIDVQADKAKGTARRSTGISPASKNPIRPDMPNLSPP